MRFDSSSFSGILDKENASLWNFRETKGVWEYEKKRGVFCENLKILGKTVLLRRRSVFSRSFPG